jgi:hypothetical protein
MLANGRRRASFTAQSHANRALAPRPDDPAPTIPAHRASLLWRLLAANSQLAARSSQLAPGLELATLFGRGSTVKNRTTPSALLAAGAAAGVGAVTWLGKRRLRQVSSGSRGSIERGLIESDESDESDDEVIDPESAELPVGRSADPEIDDSLSRDMLPQEKTTGAALLTEADLFADASQTDASFDEVWSSLPGIAEGEQSEGYDAVTPEDLGAVWLERATQTTHEDRPHGSDPNELPPVENLVVSQATIASSHLIEDEDEDEDENEDDETTL